MELVKHEEIGHYGNNDLTEEVGTLYGTAIFSMSYEDDFNGHEIIIDFLKYYNKHIPEEFVVNLDGYDEGYFHEFKFANICPTIGDGLSLIHTEYGLVVLGINIGYACAKINIDTTDVFGEDGKQWLIAFNEIRANYFKEVGTVFEDKSFLEDNFFTYRSEW